MLKYRLAASALKVFSANGATRYAYRKLGNVARLPTRGQMKYLFPEATIHAERVPVFAKSHTAVALRDARPNRTAESD